MSAIHDPAEALTYVRGTTTTSKGKPFPILDPRPSDIDPEDVAIGLANASRYSGQTRRRYSVAQHSLVVANIVRVEMEAATGCTAFAPFADSSVGPVVSMGRRLVLNAVLHALTHDGSEAYTGDMSSPLKRELPAFKEIENRIQAAVDERFGVSPTENTRALVKHADRVALVAEGRYLFDGLPEWWRVDPALVEASMLTTATPATNPIRFMHALDVARAESPEHAWAIAWLEAVHRAQVGP